MKQFICFLFIILFGTFIFFTGWTQLKVKPGTCGVIQSKTSGIDEKPIIPGEFNWNWQFLLPTNAKLISFDIKPFNATKISSGTISTGINNTVYAELLTYHFNFTIQLSYDAEGIVSLLQKNLISNNEDFEVYLNNVADTISQQAAAFYLKKLSDNPDFKPEAVKRNELVTALDTYKDFPEIDITILALTDYKMPNYPLYQRLYNQWDFGYIYDHSEPDSSAADQDTEPAYEYSSEEGNTL